MSASNPFVNEHGMPRQLSAKERRELDRTGGRRVTVDDEPFVPAEQFRCIHCKQRKPGRFTRSKGASWHGWSQHKTSPYWACWDCIPKGEGRGE